MRKSRTVVVLTNQLKLRRIHEVARAHVPVEAIISGCYWLAWDLGAEEVFIALDGALTKDRQSHVWSCKFEEFEVRENQDDA